MKLLRIRDVCEKTALSRTTVWRLERAGQFPSRLKVGHSAVRWREDEILAWIDSRPMAGNGERL